MKLFRTLGFRLAGKGLTALLAALLLALVPACSSDNKDDNGDSGEPNPPTESAEPITLTLDFARGPEIATPALPGSSKEALTGRHEYTIDGRTFAIFADAAANGKFFWSDQAQYGIPEPNLALYFSNIGTYVEFPAIEKLALSTIEYVYSKGAGELPEFDIQTTAGDSQAHSLDFAEEGSGMTFTLLAPTANTAYRLTVLTGKNAQPAKLVLTYTVPES